MQNYNINQRLIKDFGIKQEKNIVNSSNGNTEK